MSGLFELLLRIGFKIWIDLEYIKQYVQMIHKVMQQV